MSANSQHARAPLRHPATTLRASTIAFYYYNRADHNTRPIAPIALVLHLHSRQTVISCFLLRALLSIVCSTTFHDTMPHLLPPRLMRKPTIKFYAQSLQVPHSEYDLAHSHFYALQSGKLKALLDTVVDESKGAIDPQVCMDYLELTGVLTDMLNEAQHYSFLTTDELRAREPQVFLFIAKVDNIKSTIADWDQRTRRMRGATGTRKRARKSVELREDVNAPMKRRRNIDEETEALSNCGYNNPFPPAWSSMDVDSSSSPEHWWNQPCCD